MKSSNSIISVSEKRDIDFSEPDQGSYNTQGRGFNKTRNLIWESAAQPHFPKLKIRF
jgi:hypothetical protein